MIDLLQIKAFVKRKRFRKGVFIFLFVLFALFIVTFISRNLILHHYLNKFSEQLRTKYKAELQIRQSKFHGINGLYFSEIFLKPIQGDTLLTIEKLDLHLNLFKLLVGKFAINDLTIENCKLTPIKNGINNNFNFIFQPSNSIDKPTPINSEKTNYAERVDRLMDIVFNLLPSRVFIKNFCNINQYDHHEFSFHIDQFSLLKEDFTIPITIRENGKEQQWSLQGKLNKSNRELSFSLFSNSEDPISIPFINFHWNAQLQFKRISFSLESATFSHDILALNGRILFLKSGIQHNRISPEFVNFDDMGIKYQINIGKKFIEIDSSSNIQINNLDFNPYFKINNENSKQISLSIH